ncbi:MAG: acyl-CoA thioesterase [Bacteroidetes bacterium]|nr:MAG: acyl-CoA thioesterase [Bacteroidota bacterium]
MKAKEDSGLRPLFLSKPIQVNGYDIDVLGIVSNIVYVRWFEDLRFHFLDTYWPFPEMLKQEQSPVLWHTQLTYKKPLTIFDRPQGHIWLQALSRSRWTVGLEVVSEKGLHCQGEQSGYFIHTGRKRPVPIPEELRRLYEADVQRLRGA